MISESASALRTRGMTLKVWPALGDIYCNVGGVGAGRVSSSCTSGRKGPGPKRSEHALGPGPEGISTAPTTDGHHPAGPRGV
jgi:hypothetical protein